MITSTKRYGLVTAITVTIFGVLSALAAVPVGAIARGYITTDSGLSVGMVAALSTEGGSEVQRADQTSGKRVVGIVTTSDASSVTLASGDAKVLVEGDGQVEAYVSDIQGEITQGSLLVLSPLKGIMMKAGEADFSPVIAIASESVSAGSGSSQHTYTENGQNKTAKITKIKVSLTQQGAANAQSASEKSALDKFGEAVAGKEVGEIRVAVALVIFVVVLIAEGGIIYGAITSAITSLGRNPLARQVIRREMINVVFVAVVVLVLGLGAVYAILWV